MSEILAWLAFHKDTLIFIITLIVFVVNGMPEVIKLLQRVKYDSKCREHSQQSLIDVHCYWRNAHSNLAELKRNHCDNCSYNRDCVDLAELQKHEGEREKERY